MLFVNLLGDLLAAEHSEASIPQVTVAAHSNCAGISRDIPLTREKDRITLALPAHSAWMGWSRESGVDLVIHAQDPVSAGRVVVDSAPARYADDPLWLRADDRGQVHLRIEVLGRSRERSWSIDLSCVNDLTATHRERVAASVELARDMHEWFAQGGHARALQWIGALARLLIGIDGDVRTRAWLDFQLATAARRGGFLVESQGWFSRARAHADALGRDELGVMAELGIGKAELNLGRDSAQTRLLEVARQAQRLELDYPALVAEQDLCVLHRLGARVSDAIACYRKVVHRSQELEEWADYANAQSNLASALVSQGDLNGARRALDAALQAADRYDSPRVRWTAARLLASVQGWSGEYVEALATLDETLRTIEPNRPVERGQLLATLAGTYTLMGELHRALQIYEDVIADMRARGQPLRAQLLTLPAAEVELRLGLPDAAASRLRGGLGYGSSEATSDAVKLGRLNLAWALADLGDLEAARSEYAQIGHGSEGWDWSRRLRALDLELRLGLHADEQARIAQAAKEALVQRHDLAHLEAAALALRGGVAPGLARDLPWFDPAAAERVRQTARVLRSPELRSGLVARLRPLASRPALLQGPGSIDAAQLKDLLAPMEDLRAIEQEPARATNEDTLAMLERSVAIEALGADPGASGARNAATALAWHASFHQMPAVPMEMETLVLPNLAHDEVLIYPVLDQLRGTLFVGQGGRWQVVTDIDASALRHATAALLGGLESGRIARAELDRLLTGARIALGWERIRFDRFPRRLFIVAEDALGTLPWELIAMSAADPAPGQSYPELVLLQSLRPMISAGQFAQLMALGPETTPTVGMHALPAASAEPDEIVHIWSRHVVAQRQGGSTAELMRSLRTTNALVHVAGHAQAGAGLAEDAGLWIGSGERPEFVSALRLAQAGSAAELVVLNACETGRTYARGRIGLTGAAGSLVNGGARQVIATRWPVADRTARRFAVLLHEQLVQTTDVARALRAAQDELRALPAHRHPADWAAWFLLQSGPPAHDARRQPMGQLRQRT